MGLPWAERGFEVHTVDIKPASHCTPGFVHHVADVREWYPPHPFYAVFAFPPCTHLAACGASSWRLKGPEKLKEALAIVTSCRLAIAASETNLWFVENPNGRLTTHWRCNDYHFHPCDYGDPYTKLTLLWAGRDFVLPLKNPVEPVTTLDKYLRSVYGPTSDRSTLRSKTPRGFAAAVFLANKPRYL